MPRALPSSAALAVCLWLGACASPIRLDPVVVKDQAVSVPVIDPLVMNPVQFQVLPPTSKQPALFALNEDNYQNLSLNLIEIRRYLDQQKVVIDMLKSINDARSQSPSPPDPKKK